MDKMGDNSKDIHKVLTHKEGPFVFSVHLADYDKSIRPKQAEAKVLFQLVQKLPILPALAAQLEKDVVVRSIFGTAAIEGNPLSEKEVGLLIERGGDPQQTQPRAEREILNLKAAYEYVEKLPKEKDFLVTEELIRQMHGLVMEGLGDETMQPGIYRNKAVRVGDEAHGGVYTPPKAYADIAFLMQELTAWLNSEAILREDATVRAALAHYHFAMIHPFGDGNGRTARLLEAVILRSAGVRFVHVMLSNYYYQNLHDYFSVFSTTRKQPGHSVTPFLSFFFDCAIASLNELHERIVFYIRLFSLRDHYHHLRAEKKLTQRQHDLLVFLLDDLESFSFHELLTRPKYALLYRTVSERTARRDVQRLLEEKIIEPIPGNRYDLNFRLLG
jgi:Fic family protein